MDYTVTRKVGSGSFGTVWEAHDQAGTRCAVKVVNPDSPIAVELLADQFQFLSRLSHRRIVKALDFDHDSPLGPMLVLEYVDGVDLGTFIATRGEEHLVVLTLKILDGLRYLHGLGLLHGDLKPDGILILDDPVGPEIKLVDVGFDFRKGSRLPTLTGTLPYLAPEIIRNLPADGRSDLYSLGVGIYEVLTGSCPFAGSSAEEILSRHLEFTPPAPSALRPGLAPAWDTFVAGLLNKEPMMRYRDAATAAVDLSRLVGDSRVLRVCLSPPGDRPALGLEAQTRLIEEVAGGACVADKALMIRGERGSDLRNLLEAAGAAGKVAGVRVTAVSLEPEMPALSQIVEAIEAPSATGEQSLAAEVGGGIDPQACFATILDAFRGNGDRKPRLVIIDGVEAMDPGELDTLGRMAAWHGGGARLVVGCHAEELTADAHTDDNGLFEVIPVRPLDGPGLENTLRRFFGVAALPDGLVDEVERATRGDRRLLDLVLGHLWDTGGLKYATGGPSLELAWDRTSRIPGSLRDAMRERLGRLGQGALKTLGLVSAGGGQVATDCVREFLESEGCPRAVDELLRDGLLENVEGKTSMRLRWEGLDGEIGGMIQAGWLEPASLRLASILERWIKNPGQCYGLGLLYLHAGAFADAFRALVTAGDYFAQFSPGDAILAYGKALECEPKPEARAEIIEKSGDVRLARGDLGGAMACFRDASTARLSSMRKLGWTVGLRGDTVEAAAILVACEEKATASGDRVERARVLSDLGYVYHMQSREDMALQLLKEARAFFREQGMLLEAGIASNRIGIQEMRSGRIEDAARAWEEAKTYSEQAGARRHVAMCLTTLGLCRFKTMDVAAAIELMEQALSTFSRMKWLSDRAACCHNYGAILIDVGDLDRARSLATEALELNAVLGSGSATASSRMLLAAIDLEAGNLEEARRGLDRLALGPYKLNAFEECVRKRYLAVAEAMKGDAVEALALIEDSHKLACELGDADGQRQAMLRKAEILLRFGRAEEAAEISAAAQAALISSSWWLLAHVAEGVNGEALCLTGAIDGGLARLRSARAGLAPLGESLHMARVLRGLAVGHYLGGDYGKFEEHLRTAMDIFRKRGARYDYARAVLAAGRFAGRGASFIRARRYLAEASRVFKALGASDLHKEAVDEMERLLPDETETEAVTSLSRISQTLNSSYDLTTVLNLAMDLAMEYLGAERGVLLLEDEISGEPAAIVERKMDRESVDEVLSISKSIVESVRSSRESVVASDATVDPRFMHSKSVRVHNVMSVMCVPLVREDRLLGLIYLDNREVPSDFSRLEKAFVDAFANQVALAIENARNVGKLFEDVADLRARAGQKYSFANITGPGREMQEVFRQVDKAAKSSITVLLTGESGTGKELIAGLLHQQSRRKDKPLVKVNCAAIHRELLESELFGIEKNVATGVAARSGFFERADGGTVFLDEVGDMPLDTQTRVLRVLAEREFERVGGSKVLKVDVRLISATNQDLKALIERGKFRNDLYYRLNAMRIHLPPLRSRMSDLPILVERFVRQYAAENSKRPMGVSRQAGEALRRYPWPGNVRELEKCIEHAVVVADGPEIKLEHLPKEIIDNVRMEGVVAGAPEVGRLIDVMGRVERDLIVKALQQSHGVKTAAARMLGIHESTLRKKMKALGLRGDAEEYSPA